MMIERLKRALERIEDLPEDVQEELAEHIEEYLEPTSVPTGSLARSISDLPGNVEEALLSLRRESSPTPPISEHLAWPEDDNQSR